MSLRTDIASWDTKSKDEITRVYNTHAGGRGFLARAIGYAADQGLEIGATWLVKHHLEQSGTLNPELSERLCGCVATLGSWEARLHVLQCLGWIEIPARHARSMERFLSRCLADENKFVRAWAYSGYFELAKQHARYRDEAVSLLEDAEQSESSAAVLARVRALRRKRFPAD